MRAEPPEFDRPEPSAFPAPFSPVPWLPGRHLETIVPAFWPAPSVDGRDEVHVVPVAPNASVRIHAARPGGTARGTVLLVHGMGGSSESGYMRRTATLALARGRAVVRMNCRNCGGTEALSRTLYNAAQSDDVGRVLDALTALDFPRPFHAIGFSLGGALVLRYAARAGDASAAHAVVAVNPPVDLEACCRSLERPENAVYQLHFTLSLLRMLRRIARIRPLAGPEPVFRRVRTLRRLDALYTAPDAGFRSAEEYYAGASAAPHLPGLRVPALVISARNDPFIPSRILEPHLHAVSARIRFVLSERGGHLGFWQEPGPRFWAGGVALDFLASPERFGGPAPLG